MSEAPDTIDDIGDDIGAALSELRQDPAPAAQEAAPAPAKVEAETEAPEAAKVTQDGRQRNPDGTFAKADEVGQSPQASQEPAKTILPPRSWTATAKADFATLAPHVQQEILRREGEIDAGKAQWDTKAEQFNKLDAVLAPVRDQLAFNGMAPDTYVGALVNADQALRGPNKVQALQFLAQQYGIPWGSPPQSGPQQQPQGQQPQQGQPDPQYQALQQQFTQLQARYEQDAQAKASAETARLTEVVESCRNDPKYLYFDNVEDVMTKLLSSGVIDRADPRKAIDQAYSIACRATPEIQALIDAAAPKAAVQTKPNGASITGAQRPGLKLNGAASTGKDDIGDDIRGAIREVRGGV